MVKYVYILIGENKYSDDGFEIINVYTNKRLGQYDCKKLNIYGGMQYLYKLYNWKYTHYPEPYKILPFPYNQYKWDKYQILKKPINNKMLIPF